MIRYELTGTNPVELHTAVRALLESPRLTLITDSGNRCRKKDYTRFVSVKINRLARKKPQPKLTPQARQRLAEVCWDRIVYKTNSDEEAHRAIVELIEHVERKYL